MSFLGRPEQWYVKTQQGPAFSQHTAWYDRHAPLNTTYAVTETCTRHKNNLEEGAIEIWIICYPNRT